MAKRLPIVALIYDFDGTLSPGDMQEFGFIQAIDEDVDKFWERNRQLSRQNDANGILCYMYLMLQAAQRKGLSLRREMFQHFGSQVELYAGVEDWFGNINHYGRNLGLDIRHYIISSGLKEMIEGNAIAHEFENIYACTFLYNNEGNAYWPAVAVDYTAKTQFLFKINKGISEVSDNERINEFIPPQERPIPFERMIYLGDGSTDIPCMKMVKSNGGHAIAVYGNNHRKAFAEQLIAEDRVNFACAADYRAHQPLEHLVQCILDKIHCDYALKGLADDGSRP